MPEARKPRKMVAIDPEVHRQAKLVAVARGMELGALVETALLQWCRRQPEARELRRRAS